MHDQKQAKTSLAFQTARTFFNQILVTRSWNAGHGGLYVLVSKETQPNKYLDDPLRDLTTVKNVALTKINPAFMTRQLSEILSQSKDGIQFHITSLNPIRPENKAEAWEKNWLQTFEQGATEQGAFLTDNSTSFFRYMAPLLVGDNCLKCHAKQGYEKGDIRGGISVTLPHFSQDISNVLIVSYVIAGLLGIIIIVVGGRKLERQQKELLRTNQSLKGEIENLEVAENKLSQQRHFLQELIDSIPSPIFYKDQNAVYLGCNKAFENFLGMVSSEIIGKTVYDLSPQEKADKYHEMDVALLNEPETGVQIYEYSVVDSKGNHHVVQFNKATINKIDGFLGGLVGIIFDITDRKKEEKEKEMLIQELQTALEEIKTLKGIIPICMHCKGIRDDKGSWNKLEKFITEHSEAQFSHGICEECLNKYYPEEDD